jgi:hypothetical protein
MAEIEGQLKAEAGSPEAPGPPAAEAPRKAARKKTRKRKAARKKLVRRNSTPKKATAQEDNEEGGRPRTVRSFPAATFEEALVLADAIQKFAAGQEKVRKLTLFDKLGKSPESGPSRQLITNSSRYGLTTGGYHSDFLELTKDGTLATADDAAPAMKLQARFNLAIKQIEPFNFLYERCKDRKMPSKEFLIDALRETKVEEELHGECVDTFILNAKFLGLLRMIAGAERFITLDHALEECGEAPRSTSVIAPVIAGGPQGPATDGVGFESTCFYISPIGQEDTEQRKHADFFLEYVVTPALREFNLEVVRADQIGKPGMIGKQVLEHILKSRLVIADLSFHNPNVFYELCLRHVTRLPTVQIIRAAEGIPFDIEQYRTIKIDTKDLYGFLPKLQTYTSEIANQVRRALADADAVDNPISIYYPAVKLSWEH